MAHDTLCLIVAMFSNSFPFFFRNKIYIAPSGVQKERIQVNLNSFDGLLKYS